VDVVSLQHDARTSRRWPHVSPRSRGKRCPVIRVPQRQGRVFRQYQGDAVLTALDVLGSRAARPSCGRRSGPSYRLVLPRTAEPDLPGAGRGYRGARCGAQRVSPRCCASGRRAACRRADYVGMLLYQRSPGWCSRSGHHADQLPPHDHNRLCGIRVSLRCLFQCVSRRPGLPLRVDRRHDLPPPRHYTTWTSLRPSRIGLVVGPDDHMDMPSRRSSPRSTTAHAVRGTGNAPVEHALFSLRGQAAPPGLPALLHRRHLRHDVLALGAIRPSGARACPLFPGTLRGRLRDSAFITAPNPRYHGQAPNRVDGQGAVALLVNRSRNTHRRIARGTALRTLNSLPRLNGAPRPGVGGWSLPPFCTQNPH